MVWLFSVCLGCLTCFDFVCGLCVWLGCLFGVCSLCLCRWVAVLNWYCVGLFFVIMMCLVVWVVADVVTWVIDYLFV